MFGVAMSGFIKLHRGWQDSDLFKDNEPYCERAAWNWLLSHAAWKPLHRVGPQGDLIEVNEGEFHTSLRSLAKAWNWDKNKVSRFIKRATVCGNIGTSAGQGGLHITICNWAKYQGYGDKHEPQSGTSAGQARDTQEEGIRKNKNKETTSNEVVSLGRDTTSAMQDWNNFALQAGAKKILKLSKDRLPKLRKRLDEHGLDGWREALGRAGRSEMLGSTPPNWFDFDFLVNNETNILKLLEGKYDKRFSNSGQQRDGFLEALDIASESFAGARRAADFSKPGIAQAVRRAAGRT
jgi:hypothetical protein